MEDTVSLIQKTLDKIRPFIQRDGGDIEYVDFIDGIVYVNMAGACQDCVLIDSTLSDGIEIILMEEVPGVLGVRLASQMPKKENTEAKQPPYFLLIIIIRQEPCIVYSSIE